MNTYPSIVRAIEPIIADDEIFAGPGEIGRVLDQARDEDGAVVLLVKFPNAPAATTCYPGENVLPFLSVVR